ncbi:unnamed protein product [Urochloa humidicola]
MNPGIWMEICYMLNRKQERMTPEEFDAGKQQWLNDTFLLIRWQCEGGGRADGDVVKLKVAAKEVAASC